MVEKVATVIAFVVVCVGFLVALALVVQIVDKGSRAMISWFSVSEPGRSNSLSSTWLRRQRLLLRKLR